MFADPQPSPSIPGMTAREFVATIDAFDVVERRLLAETLLRRLVVNERPHLGEAQFDVLHAMLTAMLGVAILDEAFRDGEMTPETERKAFDFRQHQAAKLNGAAGAITIETMEALLADIALMRAALAARQARAQASPGPTLH